MPEARCWRQPRASALASCRAPLLQRPNLRLDVAGVAAQDADGPALKAAQLAAELNLDGLDESQRGAALVAAYVQRIGEPPTLPAGDDPEAALQPDLEMIEQQLLDTVTIDDNQLRQLASDRAGAIKVALAGVEASLTERVYVLEPQVNPLAGAERVVIELILAPL